MSVAVNLADEIVAWLNAKEDWSTSFVAERKRVPFKSTDKDLLITQVSVFTGARKAERVTRDTISRTYKPVIAVQKKLLPGDEQQRDQEIDTLSNLVEEIEDRLEESDFEGFSLISFNEEQDEDTYGLDALRSQLCFAVPIAMEFQGQ